MCTIERIHDFSYGHRVHNHESKCAHLHGHNGRAVFEVTAPALDFVGRIIDFSVVKEKLCEWLEVHWDHKFLAWDEDPLINRVLSLCNDACYSLHSQEVTNMLHESVVWVPFNPTAENMAKFLVEVVGPRVFQGTGVVLVSCRIEETRKCSATYTLKKD